MKLSTAWLKADYQLDIATDALAKRLTMAGLEVDDVLPAAADFTGVIVAEVLSLEPHPDADKLRIAQVNTGKETLQIVCGAPNVAAGIKVPAALIGATLPMADGSTLKIKASKLRGQASNGMLCSARELGMSDDHSGLMILPADAPVGQDIRTYLGLDDDIIDIDLTPNRADAFSMRGLAREAALLFERPAQFPAVEPVPAAGTAEISISNQAPADCPIYLARVIEGVNNRAATPLWLAERLRRAGIRTHDPLVDITNYVMLQLGTPMHAFDRSKISGGIVIRRANAGEQLQLINDSTAKLDENVLVIADSEKPLAIAGVMGGLASGCSQDTQTVVLEAAWFNPVTIAGKARRYSLSSDSAQRFERGVDFTLQAQAIELAAKLILDICGGTAGAICADEYADHLPARAPIALAESAIAKRIGCSYAPEAVSRILQAIGCAVEKTADGWRAQPPAWRFDLEIAEDLIEEIARVDGYANVPDRLPAAGYQQGLRASRDSRLADRLAALGLQEAITYSFIDRASQRAYFGDAPAVTLQNPISAELAEMRLSLIPGLVNTLIYNRNRQQPHVRLFELGKIFIPNGESAADTVQTDMAAVVISGSAQPEQWGTAARAVDFYDMKGIAESLLAGVANIEYRRSEAAWLHPGQSADIVINGETAGRLGCLHPSVLKALGAKGGDVWVMEIRADVLPEHCTPQFRAIGRYPAVRRDLALITDITTPAAALQQAIAEAGDEKLRQIVFFDQYQGPNLPEGKKSLAVGIILQDDEKTLQDEEVEGIMARLVETLRRDCGTELR